MVRHVKKTIVVNVDCVIRSRDCIAMGAPCIIFSAFLYV